MNPKHEIGIIICAIIEAILLCSLFLLVESSPHDPGIIYLIAFTFGIVISFGLAIVTYTLSQSYMENPQVLPWKKALFYLIYLLFSGPILLIGYYLIF